MTNKECQVNFDKMNIELNSGCHSCKCINGRIKSDIALHKKMIITKTQMKTQTVYPSLQ